MITIFTDGATEGANGKLGTVSFCGIGFYCPDVDYRYSKRIPAISNNEAEFWALITAMKWALLNNHKKVQFKMDSMIIRNRARGKRPGGKYTNHRLNALQDILMGLKGEFEHIEFIWIPRYQNYMADRLSKKSLHKKYYAPSYS